MTPLSAAQVSVALPALLLIGLTFVVWVLFYVERLVEMRREGIAPQDVATRTQARAALKRTRAADNLQNLLEIPVLFYALAAIVLLLDLRSAPFAPLAMAYVGLRVLHSAIHITYNRVVHRFIVYFTSTVVLIVMWIDVLRQVLAAWGSGDV
jgi:hypothetical protein